MDNQPILFEYNGCVSPCPFTDRCTVYGIGCNGHCHWCWQFKDEKEKK